MTAPTEKAAPIPVGVKTESRIAAFAARRAPNAEAAATIIARAIMQDRADREARPSLPDSREERIRAEAAEDERDRLYAEACKPLPGEENKTIAALACAAATWLRLTQGVQPPARSRQEGNNG